jgi:hypothetical protein
VITDPIVRHELDTTDSRFTRGFQLGYVLAKCESRESFTSRMLTSQVEALCEVLTRAGARVNLGEPEEGRYTVSWTPMEVEFR